MFVPVYSELSAPVERKGVIYTKPWVVDFLLDLAGYTPEQNLVDCLAIEPAAGEGAFLVKMAERLVRSCLKQGRAFSHCKQSLIAYDLDEQSTATAKKAVVGALEALGLHKSEAEQLACSWIRTGDYLFDAIDLPRANFIIGNPPYVRMEDIPEEVAGLYRESYPTMRGRADLYIAFYEAALRGLHTNGVCAFICADRWMLNQYGAELRSLVTGSFAVEAVIEMHNAHAFEDEVSAYPAITVIRKAEQKKTVVAKADPTAMANGGTALGEVVRCALAGGEASVPGLSFAIVKSWFQGGDPWPCSSPARLALLRRLEDNLGLLETEGGFTKVGIGVATGLDRVFITKDPNLVESARLLPLALAKDTMSGEMKWSGHYLIDPWKAEGLVDLEKYPRLRDYFQRHAELVRRRNTAQKNPLSWYRTIDRVNHALTKIPKLYIPDIKNEFNPVLDCGQTYPHHNLYFIQSQEWDLEVLGGLLLSSVGQFFIECYGVRMRGGYLRFQAQYLRRIRVPQPSAIVGADRDQLIKAFRLRDRQLATGIALKIYGIEPAEMESTLGL